MVGRVDAHALRRVADRCFEAAIDPTLWLDVVEALGDAASSTGAVVFRYSATNRGSFLCSGACAEALETYLASEWCVLNPRLSHPPSERIATDADFMQNERQARTAMAFREDFLRKHDMGWFAGTSLYRDRESQVLVSVERGHGDFARDELPLLDDAFRRMRRVVELVPAFDRRLQAAMLNGFEAARQAVAVLSSDGRLLQANMAAEALLPLALRLRHGQLHAADRHDDSAWHAFQVKLLASIRELSDIPEPIALACRGGSGLRIRGVPLHGSAGSLFHRASALLFFDPLRPAPVSAERLKAAFGLTSREACLAAALSSDFDLRRAGGSLGIGYETARSHVKAILAKSGSRSQRELTAAMALLR